MTAIILLSFWGKPLPFAVDGNVVIFTLLMKGYFFVSYPRASDGCSIIVRFYPQIMLNSKPGENLLMKYRSTIVVLSTEYKIRGRGESKMQFLLTESSYEPSLLRQQFRKILIASVYSSSRVNLSNANPFSQASIYWNTPEFGA